MTTDIRDTIEKAMNDSYNQGLDHAIKIVQENFPMDSGIGVFKKIISRLNDLKKPSNPTPQRVTEQP